MEPERSNRKENSSPTSRRRLRVILGCPDELKSPTYWRFRCRVPEYEPDSLSPDRAHVNLKASPAGKTRPYAIGFRLGLRID